LGDMMMKKLKVYIRKVVKPCRRGTPPVSLQKHISLLMFAKDITIQSCA